MDKITNNILNNIQKNDLKGAKKPEVDNNARPSLDDNVLGSNVVDIKETKAFLIDSKSMAEVMHLTKFFGPYNITKTNENKFIFSNQGSSAVLSKHGW